ncbi:hypothetical protein [Williamwhitmania taraxaci]|uniref:Uncharacterized protein n=1 Tax=Williamwhitmania taraxaci TaxID=1640674 RepID=A0A1G6U4P2_9BACT|nr:hypothetical protein [Williamwhitmania taraxaci]SDD36392.1 hypothetical protein SAMN05216323_11541 [Williamwhitmania taraxaci]
MIGAVGVILKNPEKKQVATKVPFEGVYEKTTIKTWYAIVEVLRNAFIQALYPSIDQEINIQSVGKVESDKKKGFFEKLLTPSDKKQKDK